jgi:hypothetical protein
MKFIIFLTIISEIFLNASFDYSSRGTTALQTLRINSSPRCSALGESCGSDIKDASTVEINKIVPPISSYWNSWCIFNFNRFMKSAKADVCI